MEEVGKKLLDKAYRMARTGRHADHQSILPELRRSVEYPQMRAFLESALFLRQIDAICAISRKR